MNRRNGTARRRSYTTIDNSYFDATGLDSYEKLTILLLARYAGNKDHCWPSLQQLQETGGMSRSTVKRALKSLEDRGEIRIHRRRTQSNIYTLRGPGGDTPAGSGTAAGDKGTPLPDDPDDTPVSSEPPGREGGSVAARKDHIPGGDTPDAPSAENPPAVLSGPEGGSAAAHPGFPGNPGKVPEKRKREKETEKRGALPLRRGSAPTPSAAQQEGLEGLSAAQNLLGDILDRHISTGRSGTRAQEVAAFLAEEGYGEAAQASPPRFADVRDLREARGICADCPGLDRCPLKGLVPVLRGSGDPPQWELRYSYCRYKRQALHAARVARTMEASRIPGVLRDKGFEDFQADNPSQQTALAAARSLTDRGGSLVLAGPTGTGKTLLAAAVANAFIHRGRTCVFATAPDLMEAFRDFDNREETIRSLEETELAVIDDLGAERATEYAAEQLYRLVNRRYLRNAQTVFTTNLAGEGDLVRRLGTQGRRIVSRLAEMGRWVRIDAPDRRRRSGSRRA